MQVIENFDLFRRQLNVSEDDEAAIARAQVGTGGAAGELLGRAGRFGGNGGRVHSGEMCLPLSPAHPVRLLCFANL